MNSPIFVVAVVAGLATAATAQAANAPATSSGTSQAASAPATQPMTRMNVRQQLRDDLSKNGFTNVTVMPSSFFVRATNKQGQPVAMVVSPDSVTEVTEIPAASGQHTAGMPDAGKPAGTAQKQ